MIKRLAIGIFTAILLVFAATGCHTIHGAGQDIQSVGDTMTGD